MKITRIKEQLKRIFTPRVVAVGVCTAAWLLICAGGYRLARYSVDAKNTTLAVATPRKTPFSPFDPTPTPEPTAPPTAAPPTEKIGDFQVLSSLTRADGSQIIYHYENNMITALLNGKEVLQISFEGEKTIVKNVVPGISALSTLVKYGEKNEVVSTRSLKLDEYGSVKHYYICEYDTSGRLIRRSLYVGDNQLVSTTLFYYDVNGTLLETDTKYAKRSQKIGSFMVVNYEVDERGYLKKTHVLEADGECCNYESLYDQRGNVIKTYNHTILSSDVHAEGTSIYDENHQLIESFYAQPHWVLDGSSRVEGGYFSNRDFEYEFLCDKNGHIRPGLFWGRADAGAVIIKPYSAVHILGDSCETEYDSEGSLVKCIHDRKNNEDFYWTECEFNEKQQKVKEIHHYYTTGKSITAYEYDDNGNLQKLSCLNPKTEEILCEYYYDELGRVYRYKEYGEINAVLDLVFDGDGKAYWKKWTYDSVRKHVLLCSVEYLYDSTFQRIGTRFCCSEEDGFSVQEYDGNGFKRNMTFYYQDGSFRVNKEYFYNEQEWLTRCNEYDESGALLGWWEYRHDGAGEITGWTYYDVATGKRFADTEWKRDELGRPIRITYREDRTEESRSLYEYDKNGCVNGYSDGVNSYTFTKVPDRIYQLYARCNFDDLILTIQ